MSNSSDPLIFDDPRYGDRYEIELDLQGHFVFATRFVDGIGRDPITYSRLVDVPEFHRHAIENLISKRRVI